LGRPVSKWQQETVLDSGKDLLKMNAALYIMLSSMFGCSHLLTLPDNIICTNLYFFKALQYTLWLPQLQVH
jgi:hypothetical protein